MSMNKFIILSIVVLLFSMTNIYADTFEGSENNNYLFLEIDNDAVTGNMRIEEKIISINNTIQFYKNGNFKIKLFENKIILFGIPNNDEIKVTIFDIKQKEKITLMIQKLDTSFYEKIIEKELTPLEKLEYAQNLTGLENIAEENRLEKEELEKIKEENRLLEEANKTLRNEYQQTEDVLKLIVRQDFKIPLKTTFDFDLRAIDQNENIHSQFYGNGYLGDVILTGNVIDPDGKVWDIINATTNEDGYYKSEGMYIPDNTSTAGEWFLELKAIKYFDDLEQFSTFSIVKSFFVTDIPDSNSSTSSDVTYSNNP